jgi:hypothetical protein
MKEMETLWINNEIKHKGFFGYCLRRNTWRPIGGWKVTGPHSSAFVTMVIAYQATRYHTPKQLKGNEFEAVMKLRIGNL